MLFRSRDGRDRDRGDRDRDRGGRDREIKTVSFEDEFDREFGDRR